ncbi:hypothetical protein Hs30E_15300 [Lactococcus hodotermopsidis]|uniref:DpnD/PcfM-like C-terminal domain-containing protein n=1 Tax=Pseudolactococcus hodotermopsidis TaxID=2709157 RepID=A0A6A0BC07_9LACT|nr:DpnD/PcfM family protein [Lactococcus hodotermopsidis]GFH42979.1 hypothetical protein Hs30E_15300 [Lactococcus hodotermopsidis]
MNKFNVEITETLQRTIGVVAETESDAITKVESLYKDCEIVLTDDLTDVDFDLLENNIAKIDDLRHFKLDTWEILCYLWKDKINSSEPIFQQIARARLYLKKYYKDLSEDVLRY